MRPYGIRPPAHRLPAGARPGPVVLQVGSLERSIDWYAGLLGLDTLDRSGDGAVLGAPAAGSGLEPLVELRAVPGTRAVEPRSRLGLFHFALLLPDRPALGRFVSHLAARDAVGGAADHLVSEAVYLRDPDGLGVEVYRDRPRSEWEVDDNQLRMATDPLDLRAVAASAGGEAWSGAPTGTRVGHLHLHVGDLDRGDWFYHEGLGLDRIVWSYPGAVFLGAGGYHHHLALNAWAGPVPPPGEKEARLLEWTLLLPGAGDVDAAAEGLRATGEDVWREGADAVTRDPWGTVLRLRSESA